jgi:aminoglycoside phosphotransferase
VLWNLPHADKILHALPVERCPFTRVLAIQEETLRLRRIVLEQRDQLLRALRGQAAA